MRRYDVLPFVFFIAVLFSNSKDVYSVQQQRLSAYEIELLKHAIVDNEENIPDLLNEVIALGPSCADAVVPYLRHGDAGTRRRALYVLARIENVAPSAIVIALKSADHDLVANALMYAQTHMNNSDVRSAVEDLVVRTRSSSLRALAINSVSSLDTEGISLVGRGLMSRVMERLDDYDARSFRLLVIFLGQAANSDDTEFLGLLRTIGRTAGDRAEDVWKAPSGWHKDTERLVAGALEAIQFAEANLGDERALKAYSDDALHGPKEVRVSRLELLEKFRPTESVVALAEELLHDETELRDIRPSHSPQAHFQRACDFAVIALSTWFEDFPVRSRLSRVHSPDELEEAREWAARRAAR